MVTLYDVPTDELIAELSDRLEDRIEEPEWMQFSKTGANRELPPQDDDFWYVRAGSVLRKVAIKGPIGIERLAVEYGGRKRGTNRYRVAKARKETGGKKIVRTALQQLEEEGLVETAKGEGRRITPEGRSFLDDAAAAAFERLDRPDLERYA
ncbi:30S ribosomal protein S19e [Halegenticoccus tardaugens]|uniref:30S ribosomal protein S19e n=1 Tax=Halegenticoccus tardaugens TaxID=2071624 RepID=UPI00100B65FF|nr:30S ribosomal protein S19e [Halegenticoccus tardaugens]